MAMIYCCGKTNSSNCLLSKWGDTAVFIGPQSHSLAEVSWDVCFISQTTQRDL